MRFVLHSFCGLPLRAGAIIIGLFTTVASGIAFGDVVNKLINDEVSEVFTSRDEWLNDMAVRTSLAFLLVVVCVMQLVGGLKESRVLITPFVVLASYFVCALLSDQFVSSFLGILNYREARGVVSPAVTLLFFVWIDISYITELNRRCHEAIKPGLLEV